MKKSLILPLLFTLLFTIVCATAGYGQQVHAEHLAFSMPHPKGWFEIKKEGLRKNLKKFDLTQAELDRLLKEQSSSVLVAAFTKYDPSKTPGIIPTIQIALRPNTTKDFQAFKLGLARSIGSLRKQFDEFEVVEESNEVEVGGIRSVLMIATFVMKGTNGRVFKVRSRTYSVPRPGSHFQLNFTDSPETEDCSAEFDRILKTINIGNN